MHSGRPSFSKGTPRSRAFRMRRDLRAHPRARSLPYDTTRQVLNSILALLQKTSTSANQRLGELFKHLKSMPPWPEWSSQTDAAVSSAVQKLKTQDLVLMEEDSKYEDQRSDAELIMASKLVRLNGNVAYLDYNVFKDASEELGLAFVSWLHYDASAEDGDCHVKNEHGMWLNTSEVRDILMRGGRLHVPTRTVIEVPALEHE